MSTIVKKGEITANLKKPRNQKVYDKIVERENEEQETRLAIPTSGQEDVKEDQVPDEAKVAEEIKESLEEPFKDIFEVTKRDDKYKIRVRAPKKTRGRINQELSLDEYDNLMHQFSRRILNEAGEEIPTRKPRDNIGMEGAERVKKVMKAAYLHIDKELSPEFDEESNQKKLPNGYRLQLNRRITRPEVDYEEYEFSTQAPSLKDLGKTGIPKKLLDAKKPVSKPVAIPKKSQKIKPPSKDKYDPHMIQANEAIMGLNPANFTPLNIFGSKPKVKADLYSALRREQEFQNNYYNF